MNSSSSRNCTSHIEKWNCNCKQIIIDRTVLGFILRCTWNFKPSVRMPCSHPISKCHEPCHLLLLVLVRPLTTLLTSADAHWHTILIWNMYCAILRPNYSVRPISDDRCMEIEVSGLACWAASLKAWFIVLLALMSED
jgi:hypothetical protein